MSRSRVLASLGAAAVLVAAPGMPAYSAGEPGKACHTTGVGVGIIDVPKGSKDPRAQTYIVDHVSPGTSFRRRFQVCNGTSEPVSVQLYAGAAVVENGAFRIIEGRANNELSRWISIAPAQVTVPAGQRILATASISVPDDVRSGERYAVLLAELPPQGSGVKVSNRVGVRVYLDVGRGAVPPSDFTVDTLQASRRADGNAVVTAQVHNTGGRALDMRGSLTLRDGPDGLSAGPYPATLGTTLAPGQTEPVTVILGKSIAGGPWTARLTLTSGLLQRRAEGKITFPDGAGEATPPVKAKNLPLGKDPSFLEPLAGGLAGFLVLLLLLWWFFLFAKKRAKRRETDEEVDARRAAAQ